MVFHSDALQRELSISHGFFGRKGGVSDGIYTGLNCGPGSDDVPEHVTENRNRVVQTLGGGDAKLHTLYQVHSADVVTVREPWSDDADVPQADVLVTNVPGIVIGVLTADCVPVLFCDAKAGVVGAAHAGWQGAIKGVTDNTLAAMELLGANRADITVAVGPAIGQQSYEVGAEFVERFVSGDASNVQFFKPSEQHDDKSHFNIKAYVVAKLAAADVQKIEMLGNDTCAEAQNFFSNRRRNLQGEPDYGRQVSAIMLKTK